MNKHIKEKKKIKRIGIKILSIVFVLSIILIIILKLMEYLDNKKQIEISQILNEIEISENKIVELKKQNIDIVAWIKIEDTNINYPVLQGQDNDYYLNHNYKKERSSMGSIFLDKDYDFTIPSTNLLIYGHRNKNGLMFEDLLKYKEEEFYKEHSKIRFITETEDSEYEIIAAFNSRVYYKDEKNVFRYYYFINANSKEEYYDYVNNCKESSLYNIETTAIYGEQLLTLSTCDYATKNGRFVVVAKRIK